MDDEKNMGFHIPKSYKVREKVRKIGQVIEVFGKIINVVVV